MTVQSLDHFSDTNTKFSDFSEIEREAARLRAEFIREQAVAFSSWLRGVFRGRPLRHPA
ncbi:RSP_7527 family protein [Tropicimonas sp. IMCC34043]|uniref:RSP_7527 family protein n=1 Tax=Tropicimonas sp. IMCC34043 TaxID=2248760 RepID=UPI00130020FD|nr:hypothetical protein [Tropicimonas sp. IMCC34043]